QLLAPDVDKVRAHPAFGVCVCCVLASENRPALPRIGCEERDCLWCRPGSPPNGPPGPPYNAHWVLGREPSRTGLRGGCHLLDFRFLDERKPMPQSLTEQLEHLPSHM